MATKNKKPVIPAPVDADPTTLAELLVAFKQYKAQNPLPVRETKVDRSFIDQFHDRLALIERNNGTAVYPHPDDDVAVTRITPPVETFDLKPEADGIDSAPVDEETTNVS